MNFKYDPQTDEYVVIVYNTLKIQRKALDDSKAIALEVEASCGDLVPKLASEVAALRAAVKNGEEIPEVWA